MNPASNNIPPSGKPPRRPCAYELHVGKIGRLPHDLREAVNRRLFNGELGSVLLKWLNAAPRVVVILERDFSGRPITAANLSEWRARGYSTWYAQELERRRHLAPLIRAAAAGGGGLN